MLLGTPTTPLQPLPTFAVEAQLKSWPLLATPGRSLSDTLSVSDSLTRTVATGQSIGDTVSVSDALVGHVGRSGSLSDSVSVSDALTTRTLSLTRSLADTVSVSDALTTHTTAHSRSLADTVSVSDSLSATSAHPRSLSDTVSVSDSLSGHVGPGRSLADSVSVSDSLTTRTVALGRSLSASVSVSDALTSITSAHPRSIADTVSVSDALSAAASRSRSFGDSVSVSDSLSRSTTLVRSLADSISVVDALVRGSSSYVRALVDLITLVDFIGPPPTNSSATVSDWFFYSEALFAWTSPGGGTLAPKISLTPAMPQSISWGYSEPPVIVQPNVAVYSFLPGVSLTSLRAATTSAPVWQALLSVTGLFGLEVPVKGVLIGTSKLAQPIGSSVSAYLLQSTVTVPLGSYEDEALAAYPTLLSRELSYSDTVPTPLSWSAGTDSTVPQPTRVSYSFLSSVDLTKLRNATTSEPLLQALLQVPALFGLQQAIPGVLIGTSKLAQPIGGADEVFLLNSSIEVDVGSYEDEALNAYPTLLERELIYT